MFNLKNQSNSLKLLFEKLKKDMNKYLKSSSIPEITNLSEPSFKISYETFKALLNTLCFVDLSKTNPIEQSLISDMWTFDLNCKEDNDECELRNVLVLLAGILDIKLPDIIV